MVAKTTFCNEISQAARRFDVVARRLLSCIAALFLVAVAVGTVQAGCHFADQEDWYRDFHHGEVRDGSAVSGRAISWIYDNGKFIPVQNPFEMPCTGPNCKPSNPEQMSTTVNTSSVRSIMPICLVVPPVFDRDEVGIVGFLAAQRYRSVVTDPLEDPPR